MADDQENEQTGGDQDQTQETTDDQGGSQQTAGDQDQTQETTDDQGGSQQTAGDQDQTQEATDDQGGSQQTAGDQDQSQEATDDQGGSQQTAGDQDQTQETTDDQGDSQQTAGDQDQSQEATDDQGDSQQTAGDQDQSQETTDDQGGSQQTAGDQDQTQEPTDDQSKAQQATGNKAKSQTTPGAAGAPKQSSAAQATGATQAQSTGTAAQAAGATQAQSTGTAGSGVKAPVGFEILEGIDVSYAQGKIDWNAVKGSGVAFAYAKATDGKDPDKTFKTNWAGAGAAGILRGAYHYFYPVAITEDHLQKQVDGFLAQMGSLAKNDLPPMVDVEQSLPLKNKSGTVIFPTLPPKDIAAALTYWLTKVAQGCGRQPIIYTFPAYWKSMLGDSTSFHDYHLWIAHYGSPPSKGSSERPPLGRTPTIPGGWPTYSIWQYAVLSGLPGIGGYVDRDQIIVPTGTSIGDFLNGSPPNPSQK